MTFREYLENLFSAPSRRYRFVRRLRAQPQRKRTIIFFKKGVLGFHCRVGGVSHNWCKFRLCECDCHFKNLWKRFKKYLRTK